VQLRQSGNLCPRLLPQVKLPRMAEARARARRPRDVPRWQATQADWVVVGMASATQAPPLQLKGLTGARQVPTYITIVQRSVDLRTRLQGTMGMVNRSRHGRRLLHHKVLGVADMVSARRLHPRRRSACPPNGRPPDPQGGVESLANGGASRLKIVEALQSMGMLSGEKGGIRRWARGTGTDGVAADLTT